MSKTKAREEYEGKTKRDKTIRETKTNKNEEERRRKRGTKVGRVLFVLYVDTT